MTPLRYTRQQLADALQAWVAMDRKGKHRVFERAPNPMRLDGIRFSGWHLNGGAMWSIPDFVEIVDPVSGAEQSLTAPRTEAEPRVCEWHWNAAANRGYGGWFGYCGAKRGHNESVPDRCDCSRPIRIVEGAEHG